MAADYTQNVYTLFVGYTGRPPAPAALSYYKKLMEDSNGDAWKALANDLWNGPETKSLYEGKSTEAQVNQVFQFLFGRDAAPAGLNYWTEQVQSGAISLPEMAYTIAYNCGEDDRKVLDAKLGAAADFAAALDETDEILAYTDASGSGRDFGRDWLKGVTDQASADAATTTEALDASTDKLTGTTPAAGETFTLTDKIDVLAGTAGDDTFVGNSSTANAGDQIDGKGGTDTFTLYAEANAIDGIALPQMTSIENLLINQGKLANTKTLDVSSQADLKAVTLENPEAMVDDDTFTVKTTADQTVTLIKVKGTAGGNASTVKMDGATSVTLDGVNTDVALDVTSTAAALNLTASGEASAIALTNTGAKLESLTVDGDAALNLGDVSGITTLAAVDASAATGGVELKLDAAKSTFTGGSGDDNLAVSALPTKAVDGGEGDGDVLSLDSQAKLSDITSDALKSATNFEIIGLTGASFAGTDGNFDFDAVDGFTGVQLNGTASSALTFSNASATASLDILKAPGQDVTVSLKTDGKSDTMSLTLGEGDKGTAGLDLSGKSLTLTKFESINIESTANDGNAAKVKVVDADATTITVTGDGALEIDAASTLGKVTTFDASAATGAVTIATTAAAFDAKGATITGGSGDDAITLNKGAHTVAGGEGADKVTVVANDLVTTFASLADWSKGDMIDFADLGTEAWVGGAAKDAQIKLSDLAVFTDYLSEAVKGDGSANAQVAWFQFQDNTYVVVDNDAGNTFKVGTDLVVKLTGTIDLSEATLGDHVITLA